MKKITMVLSSILTFVFLISGCSNDSTNAIGEDANVKVGIRNSELRTWEYLKGVADKEGIEIEIVNFSSAYDPNQALIEGDIDINAFQHVAYLDSFNANADSDIVPIGSTIIAPLGLYSSKYKSVEDIPTGAQIAVPNDASNWGRSLLLLQDAGFITVVDDFDGNGGEDKIKENIKDIEIVPVDSANAPRVMEDTAGSVINNGVALEAGLTLKDALVHESKTAKPYINVIAARGSDKDNKIFQQIVGIYQSEATAEFIEETYKGNYLPTFITLEELSTYKETYSNQ
ncbi:MetQ/NlpA family ABC transporter substrate-binding protein [Cytobacillus purgationiresistens]|uniref:Lipoprotein n=1 Tax=Cytobacillus purgationiresistens TaxID=863449 RepID=A0ABU0AAA8_9BACI|nr:MetQ/NlpA family ABC transporter substrate-binding protein [Cytobacillus purgationiresistens]MDQ0268180.1 D-methionine transport system substrate-binding protein [Cytobacillus purgationiresistens]